MRILTFVLLGCILGAIAAQSERFQFVAEVGRLMDIIINSLYTQKEIFLRQLISNASDALDKIRFESIQNPEALGTSPELEIKVDYDPEARTVEIIDNGVGMTKNELISNLGTVAKSGTSNFLETMKSGEINLIGQFGVGFYSSFLVGARVEVTSKHNSDVAHKWISTASNSFTVELAPEEMMVRGTRVRIYLKEDASEFSELSQLEKLIKRYSAFINYPIYLKRTVTNTETFDKTDDQITEEREKIIKEKEEQGAEVNEEEIENAIIRTYNKSVTSDKFERMNEQKSLWTRDKSDIKNKEYKEFYKTLFKDTNNPTSWSHFKAEGEVDFTGLIFIPERINPQHFEKFYEKKTDVKLFVRRVLVNDQFEDLLPKYLNFLRTLVDSDSLSLNVNRQNLQDDKILKAIGNKLHKKAVDMLLDFNPPKQSESEDVLSADEDTEEKEAKEGFSSAYAKKVDTFNKFWRNFHKNIKLGVIEDSPNREKLASLTRWYTSHNSSELTSLDEYIERMKEGQTKIYFLGGVGKDVVLHSPMIERLVKEGYEVILGDDPLDETIFSNLREYKKIKIMNVARTDFKEPYKTDEVRKEIKFMKKKFQPLIDYAQQQLKDHVKEVRVSMRLVDSPVVMVADMSNDTPNKQRIESLTSLRGQVKYQREKDIMEINPFSPIIQELNDLIQNEEGEGTVKLVKNLYSAGLVHSGYAVKDPHSFSRNIFSLITTAFNIKQQEQIEQMVVTDADIEAIEEQAATEVPAGESTTEEINLDSSTEAGGNVEIKASSESNGVADAPQFVTPEDPSTMEL